MGGLGGEVDGEYEFWVWECVKVFVDSCGELKVWFINYFVSWFYNGYVYGFYDLV